MSAEETNADTDTSGDPNGVPVRWNAAVSPDRVDFDKQGGLVPGVVQDNTSREVLMVGYLDRDALAATLATGLATFHSRSRNTRWVKGESSGNVLRVREVRLDCDRDTLLILADPAGPTCHTGAVSCFDPPAEPSEPPAATSRALGSFLAELDALVAARHAERPDGSYTTSLFESGPARIAQKVGEEGVETALAAVTADDAELTGEAADLLFHLLVLLRERGLGLAEVEQVLIRRHSHG